MTTQHPLLHAMKAQRKAQGTDTMWLRETAQAGKIDFGVAPTPTTSGAMKLTVGKGYYHFDAAASVAPPPPPPPPNGAPPLPTGPITLPDGTAVPAATFLTTFASQPTGTYWFESNNPGAGYNTKWPGNLAVPSAQGLQITTENQGGVVASGGVGMDAAYAQSGAINVADFTIMYGRVLANLVRYGLWWPGNWPIEQEFDQIEGWPGASRMTWHGESNNTAVGHILQTALAEAGVWYAVRTIWKPGASGYLSTLVGDSFDSLTLQSELSASELPATIDGTPHAFDLAVEAEGPIDVTTDLATPNVDVIGGLALYSLAA